jgi:hypothetical protein
VSILSAVESGKRLIAATLVDRCVLLDPTNVPDDSGGTTTTLLPRALDVPCNFGRLTETDIRVIAGSAYGPATATLTLPLEVEIDEGVYVQDMSDDDSFWLIVGNRTPRSKMAPAQRVLIREATWVA